MWDFEEKGGFLREKVEILRGKMGFMRVGRSGISQEKKWNFEGKKWCF